jgi:hypothetical protein
MAELGRDMKGIKAKGWCLSKLIHVCPWTVCGLYLLKNNQEAEIMKPCVQSPALQKRKRKQNKKLTYFAGRVAKVIECLPCKCKVLSSNSSTAKK